MNPKVDAFLNRAKKWQTEMERLRAILQTFDLTEDLKWGKPCYTVQGGNVVLLVPFKDYCALIFSKGALINDSSGLLIQPTENSQASRQIRLASIEEINENEAAVRACIQEAIEIEKNGLKVEFKETKEFSIPEEFQTKLEDSPDLKTAFYALTPGRQRAYLLHFAAPKQSKTRESRVEKCREQILNGKGLND
jgi:uncharacterized protein YdeI (YjbR/CyaY-like superfamily)